MRFWMVLEDGNGTLRAIKRRALVADGFHSLNDFADPPFLIMLMFRGDFVLADPTAVIRTDMREVRETFSTFLMSSFLIIHR